MRKQISTGYRLTIEALFADVSNLGDGMSLRQSSILNGTVANKTEALKAVNDYFDSLEDKK